jgi:thymidylate synthase
MRFYTGFGVAVNEITRELAEMGISVHPQTMQDKVIAEDPDYNTRELQNYMYMVSNPLSTLNELTPNQPWADKEFDERVSPYHVNPGEAWKLREEIWKEYLHNGRFSYTYNERMSWDLSRIMNELDKHPDSRQLYLSIWDPTIDVDRLGSDMRIPCSLGYLFQLRRGKLNMTYFMRSCDFITHYHNDVYLAVKLLKHVSDLTGNETGTFTHYIGSLHVYEKDVRGIF